MKKAMVCVRDQESCSSLKKRLKEQGIAEIIVCATPGELLAEAAEEHPTLAVLEQDTPAPELNATVKKLWERLNIPVLLLTEDCDLESARQWAEAGVAALLTMPLREEELTAALALSLAAARRTEALKGEVSALKESIEARKVVEKAKGRLMERDGLTEAEAFRRMQRLAMDRRISMRQLAEAILLTDRIGDGAR